MYEPSILCAITSQTQLIAAIAVAKAIQEP
jgi:hypothetical protein